MPCRKIGKGRESVAAKQVQKMKPRKSRLHVLQFPVSSKRRDWICLDIFRESTSATDSPESDRFVSVQAVNKSTNKVFFVCLFVCFRNDQLLPP